MTSPHHPFHELFEQLGLPSDADSIARFLREHGDLPGDVALSDAPFWLPAQAAFLRETLHQDSDWSHQVDQLNKALHGL
ncbi:hypothetical protein B9Z51_10095 [Limnohabitans sp. T6-5]|uniref:DUF2789 family protein n=1 Tax=Limnohabitans sp. T6-5 TaxID=1100724 RepID=UPI000D3CFCF6|nr:DUF2789 family protein [Limnohabitans sp. T6-5]PUE09243.1 hypothetical protein B9Z51_10095 [Limnohabitans sp. T6-5]